MLSIHFNGHSQHHPEANGRPLRDQLDEAFRALGFTRGLHVPPAPSEEALRQVGDPRTDDEDGATEPAFVAPETAEAPKPRRGRPPKVAETPQAETHRLVEAEKAPAEREPAPQISASPEDRKSAEEPAATLTHDDIRMAIGEYGKKFGDDVAVKNGRTFMGLLPGQKIPEIPTDRIGAVVAALRNAVMSGKAEPTSTVDDLG